jgi:alginate O-acetyltransferase complex protein AlgI
MSFTSGAFLVLMGLFMAGWGFVRPHRNLRWIAITGASFVFYGWWDWRFLPLLVGTGLVDYFAALAIERWPSWRRPLLWASVASNIGVLAFFKYLRFLVAQLVAAADVPAAVCDMADGIVLPVGISFYTFQSLSYTIDVYRGHIRAVRDPFHFFAFLSMFPQLVAGPIVRAVDLLPQLETPGNFNRANRMHGLRLAAWGYLKKAVVADSIAPLVNEAFGASPELGLGWWVVAGAFALQIFCDFSGYSDIACGIAYWMGYRFPENFRRPYAAIGPRDFWSRWHITLSTWFRDYVYVPLGGSRLGASRTAANQTFTMLVSGLWHGANWTFVAWGAYHAALLQAERVLTGGRTTEFRGWKRWIAWATTLAAVVAGWALFRAESIRQALQVYLQMLGLSGPGVLPRSVAVPSVLIAASVMSLACVHHAVSKRRPRLAVSCWPLPLQGVAVVAALAASVFLRGPGSDFIYFQF